MRDILGLDTLVAEMIVAVGLALLVGNLWAWRKHRRGEIPKGVEGVLSPGSSSLSARGRAADDDLGPGLADYVILVTIFAHLIRISPSSMTSPPSLVMDRPTPIAAGMVDPSLRPDRW